MEGSQTTNSNESATSRRDEFMRFLREHSKRAGCEFEALWADQSAELQAIVRKEILLTPFRMVMDRNGD